MLMMLKGPSHQRKRRLFGKPLSAEGFTNRIAKFHPTRRYITQVFRARLRVEANAATHRLGVSDDDGPKQPGLCFWIGTYLSQPHFKRSLVENQIVRYLKTTDLCGSRMITS